MRSRRLVATIAWLSGLWLACSASEESGAPGQPAGPEAVAIIETFRGTLVRGHEMRSFTTCDGRTAAWFVDETGGEIGQIYEQLASEAGHGLFFEVRGVMGPSPESGFGADYAGLLEVREVRRAENEGWGCREDFDGLSVRAFGVEPFWSVEIRPEGAVLRRPHMEGAAEWTDVKSSPAPPGAVRWEARGSAGDLEITLVERRCVDAMAGSHFAWHAQVRVGDEALSGCAVTGDAFSGG